jgi:PAS domain S-box-containing protein
MNIHTSLNAFYATLAATFCFWLILLVFVLSNYLTQQQMERDADNFQQANNLRILIETEINIAAFLATGIESYIVARQGQVENQEMLKMLSLIYQRGPYFKNIGIAPDNRVDMVFPLEGNEAAIGLHYQDNPKQWPAVQKIIESKQGLLAGPLTLVQGGTGLIYRTPVYIDQVYWGLLSTVIDADRIFKLIEEKTGEAIHIALRGKDATGIKGDVFYGDASLFANASRSLSISVPGGEWSMAFKGASGTGENNHVLYLVFFIVALCLALMSSFLIHMWMNRNLLRSLKVEVNQRTSELKQANKLFESVLESANAFAIIVLSPEGIIRLFNSGAERMLGYKKEELIEKASLSLCMFDYPSEQSLFQSFEKGGVRSIETDYKHKNGEKIPVHLVLSQINDTRGGHAGYLAIAEDISERKRIEQMKNEFISTVSHELRTPLTAISGALGLIRGGVAGQLSETLDKMLEVAFNNSQRLQRLVNDLLDMEKLLAGKMSFELSSHSVCRLLKQAIESNQSYADQYQVTLIMTACEPGMHIRVDSMRFAQIMSNILSNAVKFSPTGGHVDICAGLEVDRVRVAVRDFGPGIPDAFHSQIFQKFSQADSSDSRQKGGTGLGLAITRELVERMQGEIGFVSTLAGTEFYIYFQVVPAISLSDLDGKMQDELGENSEI